MRLGRLSPMTTHEEILKHKLLTHEEEKELWLRYSGGDESARHELVRHNIRLVGMMASHALGRRSGGLSTHQDLVSEGIPALYEATKKFDPRKGPFIAIARFKIKRAFSNYFRSIGNGAVTVSRDVKKSGTRPKFLSTTPTRISPRHSSGKNTNDPIESEMAEMVEQIGDAGVLPGRADDVPDLCETLRQRMKELPPRSQEILIRRFGLDGKNGAILADVGKGMNLTRERIRQIEAEALKKLRSMMVGSGYTSTSC